MIAQKDANMQKQEIIYGIFCYLSSFGLIYLHKWSDKRKLV